MRIPSGGLSLFLIVTVAAGRRSIGANGIEIVDVGRYNFTGGGAAESRLIAATT